MIASNSHALKRWGKRPSAYIPLPPDSAPQTKDLRLSGLPKIRNWNGVETPPKQNKSTLRAPLYAAWEAARAANKANTIAATAVAMAIIAIIISTFAWIYPHR